LRSAVGRLRSPHLLALTIVSVLLVITALALAALTGSAWWAGLAFVIVLVGTAALVAGVEAVTANEPDGDRSPAPPEPRPAAYPVAGPDFTGAPAERRLLVVVHEPVDAASVMRAAAAGGGSVELGRLAVMVVAPEGLGSEEITGDEQHYSRARDAEETTVAELRREGVSAAGHVGDHDLLQAIRDAVVLFPADRTVVFAGPGLPSAQRGRLAAIGADVVETRA
jgi:hypothetical protein